MFMVVADCDLYTARNISAKGLPLVGGADGTALSLEHLHEIGSVRGEARLCYTDAAHKHLSSKYRHTQHCANLSRTDKTYILGNEDLACALGIRQPGLGWPGNYISGSSRTDKCITYRN